jgi:hypothetical protein
LRRHIVHFIKKRVLPAGGNKRAKLRDVRAWLRYLGSKDVRLDRILWGGDLGLTANAFAHHTASLLRPSTPVLPSPHSELLSEFSEIGPAIFEADRFSTTSYYHYAAEVLSSIGAFFTAYREEEIVNIAKCFVAKFNRLPLPPEASTRRFSCFSSEHGPVVLRPVIDSRHYQVADGYHRLAMAFVRGQKKVRAYIVGPPAQTPLQELLCSDSYLRGAQELHQPIDTPDTELWPVHARCVERFGLMRSFLERSGYLPPMCTSYLDLGARYGWFVRAMREMGFIARAVEMDWACVAVGVLLSIFPPSDVERATARHFFARSGAVRYDVVSCFGLLHRCIQGGEGMSAECALAALDRITGKVLFFDSAPDSNTGWGSDVAAITDWVCRRSSFINVVKLGTDGNAAGCIRSRYGRMVFACTRL